MPRCSVCARTPRALTDEHVILKVPLTPVLTEDSMSSFCSECGAKYIFQRTNEWDDGSYYESVSLRRLSYAESQRPSPRPDFHAELSSTDEWVRRNAAWNSCEAGEAMSLLWHADSDVREEALTFVAAKTLPVSDEALLALRIDERAVTRKLATSLWVPKCLTRGEAGALIAEIVADDDVPRIVAALWQLTCDLTPDAGAASRTAIPLLAHADAEVRDKAGFLLAHVFREQWLGADAALLVAGYAERSDAGVASAALRALQGLRWPSIDAVNVATPWLLDRTVRFHALQVLESQAKRGAPITVALPSLRELLASGGEPAGPCKVLLAALPHATDKLPVIAALVPALRGHWATSAAMAIDNTARAGVDLSSLLPELRKSVTSLNEAWLKQIFASMGVG